MPASERVDWQAVETGLISELSSWPQDYEHNGMIHHALAAVKLVRALEEGPLNGIVLVGIRNRPGGWQAVVRGPRTVYGATPLAAVEAALGVMQDKEEG